MKITTFARKTKSKNESKKHLARIYIRVYVENKIDLRVATPITVNMDYWDAKRSGYKAETPDEVIPRGQRLLLSKSIWKIIEKVRSTYEDGCDAKWLASVIDECTTKTGIVQSPKLSAENEKGTDARTKGETSPERGETGKEKVSRPAPQPQRAKRSNKALEREEVVKRENQPEGAQEKRDDDVDADGRKTLLGHFRQYLDEADFGSWHREAQTSVMHRLERYEKWLGFVSGMPDYKLMLEEMDKEAVEDFAIYMEREHEYRDENPELYDEMNLYSPYNIRPVSKNSVTTQVKRLCMFLNWAVKSEYLEDTSFRNITCDQQLYGTPFYLTIEERDRLYNMDLSENPPLETYRDMFVFQCLVGCRFGDLVSFTTDNIIDGVLEYVPEKTRNRTGASVRVPLGEKAMAIIRRQDLRDGERLFKNRFNCKFNDAIREILTKAGITRIVTVINPSTRLEEKRPLNEIATSHMARRTFIGNLYKKVKDPNLIASMSGHVQGSKAFVRYRAIDDDMKKELIDMIQ